MKRVVLLFLSVLSACIGLVAGIRVLSVGISEYPESSGWCRLNARNDLQLMRSVFPDVRVLEDESAGRAAIVAELQSLSARTIAGDTVIIHFSGHGQQIITENSSDEADNVDEAIVAYDAARRRSATYTGENHLTDDDFGREIAAIRRKAGPDGLVIAVIDACHSDTMDKAADKSGDIYRGTDEIFGAENMSAEEISELKKGYHNQETYQLESTPDMSDLVFISACRSDQRNYEIIVSGVGYGSLTYYFCKAVECGGLEDLPEFLDEIYLGMRDDRTLRFHGQLPAIRNTVGWVVPEDPAGEIAPMKEDKNTPADVSHDFIAGIIVAAIMVIILVALWMRRRGRK